MSDLVGPLFFYFFLPKVGWAVLCVAGEGSQNNVSVGRKTQRRCCFAGGGRRSEQVVAKLTPCPLLSLALLCWEVGGRALVLSWAGLMSFLCLSHQMLRALCSHECFRAEICRRIRVFLILKSDLPTLTWSLHWAGRGSAASANSQVT